MTDEANLSVSMMYEDKLHAGETMKRKGSRRIVQAMPLEQERVIVTSEVHQVNGTYEKWGNEDRNRLGMRKVKSSTFLL